MYMYMLYVYVLAIGILIVYMYMYNVGNNYVGPKLFHEVNLAESLCFDCSL